MIEAGDIGLFWSDLSADLRLAGGDLWQDAGLETAIIVSLFSDRRADLSDALPDESGDLRGWWGDAVPDVPGDMIGSKLWLLAREKEMQVVVERARAYAVAALAWMLEDRVADSVEVNAEIVRRGVLGLQIIVHRPVTGRVEYRFNYNWDAQAARR